MGQLYKIKKHLSTRTPSPILLTIIEYIHFKVVLHEKNYRNPRSAKLVYPLLETITWSCSGMPMVFPASTS